jgi:hypothetical protein
MAVAGPREKMASRKPLPVPPAMLAQRSPTDSFTDICRRSEEIQGAHGFGIFERLVDAGEARPELTPLLLGCNVRRLGELAAIEAQADADKLVRGTRRLSNGMTHTQPPLNMW